MTYADFMGISALAAITGTVLCILVLGIVEIYACVARSVREAKKHGKE